MLNGSALLVQVVLNQKAMRMTMRWSTWSMPVTTARALLWAAGLTVMSVRTLIFALDVTMPKNTQTGNTRRGVQYHLF